MYRLSLGAGWLAVNVYFIGSAAAWCLVDAGWPRDEPAIRGAAEAVFGAGARPAAIVLTHAHPDHAGAARALARAWTCPVLVHPDELPLASGDAEAIHRYAGPLDRYAILPAMRLAGRRRMRAALAKGSLTDAAAALGPAASVPGLAEWTVLPTPGHTPGHIALVRGDDGVALTGDALNTVELNSPWGAVRRTRRLCGPPRVATWDRRRAVASAVALAELHPRVVGPGHGAPMGGDELAGQTQAFLARHRR